MELSIFVETVLHKAREMCAQYARFMERGWRSIEANGRILP